MHYYLITGSLEAEKNDGKFETIIDSCIVTSNSPKISKALYVKLHMHLAQQASEKYKEEVKQIKSVSLLAISYLGDMTEEEFNKDEQ